MITGIISKKHKKEKIIQTETNVFFTTYKATQMMNLKNQIIGIIHD